MTTSGSIYFSVIFICMYLCTARECPGSKFGPECRYFCHCKDQAACNVLNGECPNKCDNGWSGHACQRQNLAYMAPVEVRKVNTSGREVVDENKRTCIATRPKRTGWLKVDLGAPKRIYSMEILTGNDTDAFGWKVHVTDFNHNDLFWRRPCTKINSHGSKSVFHCDRPFIGQYVSIFSYDRPVNVCDFRVYACPNYTFGEKDCRGRCACLDKEEVCHPVFGTCKSGCKAGRTGSGCQQECIMSYGSNCVHVCGHCLNGKPCDIVTGNCPSGCDSGYNGAKCTDSCKAGKFGYGCRTTCGHCKNNDPCDHVSGMCPNGCKSGWFGMTCVKKCGRGLYGEDCKFSCENCLGMSCDRFNGVCGGGCVPGWEGVFCTQECLPGKYGKNCLYSCGKCLLQSCNKQTGSCSPGGCLPGFYGDTCDYECPAGKYGPNCLNNCGVCQGRVSCDPMNGTCPGVCEAGWTSEYCNEKCGDENWGHNCNKTCGVCKERLPCHHVTGICDNGCAEGYHGDFCVSNEGLLNTNISDAAILTFGSAMGTIVTLFLIMLLTCIIVKWRRERNYEDYDFRVKKKLIPNGHV